MKNKKIICNAVRTTNKGNLVRDWEITADGKVWPCCYFANAWDRRHEPGNTDTSKLVADKRFKTYLIEHQDFNDLTQRSMDDIIEDKIYNTYIWYEGWDSETPPKICEIECSSMIDASTGEEVSGATLSAHSSKDSDK